MITYLKSLENLEKIKSYTPHALTVRVLKSGDIFFDEKKVQRYLMNCAANIFQIPVFEFSNDSSTY